jgi:hypothetical protein
MTSLGFPKPFDKNVSYVIVTFLTPKQYKFFDWVYHKDYNNKLIDQLNWQALNIFLPGSLLEKFPDRINYRFLSLNPNAIDLIEKSLDTRCCPRSGPSSLCDKINWKYLCGNENAIHILKNPEYKTKYNPEIDMNYLCANPNGIEMVIELKHLSTTFSEHKNPINLFNKNEISSLCANPNAIHLLNKLTNNFTSNTNYIDWEKLSGNPNAIDILLNNFNTQKESQINWWNLSRNKNVNNFMESLTLEKYTFCLDKLEWLNVSKNPDAIPIIEYALKHCPDKINWTYLCKNPNAMHIIEPLVKANDKRINWYSISSNSNAIDLMLMRDENGVLQYIKKIDWISLCWENSNAHLVLKHVPEKFLKFVRYTNIQQRLCLYEIDYEEYNCMKKKCLDFIYNL